MMRHLARKTDGIQKQPNDIHEAEREPKGRPNLRWDNDLGKLAGSTWAPTANNRMGSREKPIYKIVRKNRNDKINGSFCNSDIFI